MSEFKPPTTPSIPSSHLTPKEGVASEPSDSHASGTPALPLGACSTVPIWKASLILTALSLQWFCKAAGANALNVSVGFISQSLHFTEQETSWIQSAYSLGSACFLMLFIPISIQFGARSVWLCSTLLYIAGAIGCSATQNATQFLAFRTLQGIGAAGSVPSAFQMLHQVFPVVPGSTARDMAFAIFSSGFSWGGAVGVVISGLSIQYSAIQWRAIFVILACLSAVAWSCVLAFAPPSIVEPVPGGVDYTGGLLVTVALTLTLFSLSQGSHIGWQTPYVITLLVVGIVFFPIFYAWEVYLETNGRTPMIRMSNFRRGRYALVSLLSLVGFVPWMIWDVLSGLFWHSAGYSAVQVMLRFLPLSIAGLIAPSITTYALSRMSTQIVFITGCVLVLCSNIIFAVATPQDTYWNRGQFLAPGVGQFGVTFIYMSGLLYLVGCVPPDQAAASGSWYAVILSFSVALGNIVAFVVIADYPTTQPNIWANGYRTGIAWAALTTLAAIPAFWGIGTVGADVLIWLVLKTHSLASLVRH
ncbi:MFS general substrate transporter [Hymenopellis radicata]|nr:MFS general substrate transporter [Hymenopellis radicata]